MKKVFYLTILIAVVMISCNNSQMQNQQTENQIVEEKTTSDNNVAINCMLNRRSIRAYKPEQIKDEELQTILKCAINAPSARNLQPWEIRVIQDEKIISELNKAVIDYMIEKNPEAKERFASEDVSLFFNAPTLLLIAYDSENYWGMNDCGMLAQNVLLAAEALNIGTCTIGCCREYFESEKAQDFIKTLNFPENYVLHLGVTLGYKDQMPEAKPRNEEKIKFVK